MTSDLSLRIPHPGRPARLVVHGERIRTGRRLVTTAVRLEADDGPFAYGETTFVRVPREPENAPPLEALQTPNVIPSNPLSIPLIDAVGIELDRDAPGRVRLDLRPALLNPEGIMQGALVALVIECAALSLADSSLGDIAARASAQSTQHAIRSLDLRYLSAISVGPVIGEATWLATPDAQMIRVELRDAGREQRLTASALIGVTALPRIP